MFWTLLTYVYITQKLWTRVEIPQNIHTPKLNVGYASVPYITHISIWLRWPVVVWQVEVDKFVTLKNSYVLPLPSLTGLGWFWLEYFSRVELFWCSWQKCPMHNAINRYVSLIGHCILIMKCNNTVIIHCLILHVNSRTSTTWQYTYCAPLTTPTHTHTYIQT